MGCLARSYHDRAEATSGLDVALSAGELSQAGEHLYTQAFGNLEAQRPLFTGDRDRDGPGVDYVAMDIKTLPAYYDRLAAAPVSSAGTIAATTAGALRRSMSILRAWRDEAGEGSDHQLEFRTSCAPGIVTAEELAAIPALLSVGDRWILNQFRPGNCLDPSWNTVRPYPPDVLLAVADSARSEGIDAHVRGV